MCLHEIMNTIAPIISLSQTLSAYTDVDQKVHRGLDIIRTQGERLMEFTESFRHLSYLPPPDKAALLAERSASESIRVVAR